VCTSPSPPGPPPAVRLAPPFHAPPKGSGHGEGSSPPASTKPVIDAPVSDGVSRWRAFIELVLRELS
jgi:hypothetical protein